MSQPFSGIPDPGFPRRRRRFEPGIVQEALQAARRQLETAARGAMRHSQSLWQRGRNLWQRGKRRPRVAALVGGALALTLVGAYSLSASGAGRSHCPPAASSPAAKGQKTARFLLLMDQVPHPAAGSELEIYYDVCGLASGTRFSGRVRLLPAQTTTKKKSAKPKPLTVAFKGEVDGPATRRYQELELGVTKPGTYTLELAVVDNQGRERKRFQKIRVKAQ
ncbi:MAG TPA: hypothetical protein VFH26_10310 [Gemmatimonadales bacterium]|nr:hypothetical protein [Gemmatimonadales bacterium]